ncbi:uncharacterized protein KY384_000320 [Bacidia gigantensis]|uniref:uncharacterized protein n=1 Tax=Bacidia gigantensis TaxID=2732470 RepID=UPI001D052CFC|nr:uncharacterized protein KY384_000320 [Bacidia gigantensis]KAG8526327.1 hypothetical protein KY384_000320 [Bacidia gigantensis]
MAVSESVFSQYQKPVLVGVGLVLTILPIIVVALRFWIRRRSPAGFGLDDWCILVALVLCTGGGIVEILLAEIAGMGRHQRLTPSGELMHYRELTNYEKCRYAIELLTTINLSVIKISILLFYRRLFTVRPFRIASNIFIGVVAAWGIAFESAMAAQCSPTHLFWDLFEMEYVGHCINVQMMYQALAYSDLILDILVLAFPIPMIISLRLPWKKKIQILDIFLLGGVVLASGIGRLVSFLQTVDYTNHNPEKYFKDTLCTSATQKMQSDLELTLCDLGYTAGPLFWLFAENSIAIIGACLPTLAALWQRGTPKSSKGSKGSSYYTNSWIGPKQKEYETIDSPYINGGNVEDASIRHLVAMGPSTNIRADSIPLHDRPNPQEGIKVNTTLQKDTKKYAI